MKTSINSSRAGMTALLNWQKSEHITDRKLHINTFIILLQLHYDIGISVSGVTGAAALFLSLD